MSLLIILTSTHGELRLTQMSWSLRWWAFSPSLSQLNLLSLLNEKNIIQLIFPSMSDSLWIILVYLFLWNFNREVFRKNENISVKVHQQYFISPIMLTRVSQGLCLKSHLGDEATVWCRPIKVCALSKLLIQNMT